MLALGSQVDIVLELVVHESLIAPLEDRQVLEFLEVHFDVFRGNEEASEKHEGNDQDGSQGHSQLLVREGSRDDKRVSRGSVVDQDESKDEGQEVLHHRVEAHEEVNNATEDGRGQDREGQLRDNLGPEVRSAVVHIVVHFTQEHRSLIREDQDYVLNSVHRDVHGNEEESTLSVLNTFLSVGVVPEENNGEESSHNSSKKLNI